MWFSYLKRLRQQTVPPFCCGKTPAPSGKKFRIEAFLTLASIIIHYPAGKTVASGIQSKNRTFSRQFSQKPASFRIISA
jgi:hypothetical protein